uniref:Uncharacterized protein n=1 Tax=Rhizophora mucronata TaxID=61149 RepID=A0A2P2QAE4_RHIMU
MLTWESIDEQEKKNNKELYFCLNLQLQSPKLSPHSLSLLLNFLISAQTI